jgi:3-hydroxyisobutyrate dehydrogenase-like beta-hydroxyacid dehydrogenase
MRYTIGFIGLGIMGQPMALNLIKAGHKLAVYNRTAAKAEPLRQAGAQMVSTPGAAVQGADFVVLIVTDSAAVEEVVTGQGGILGSLSSGAIVIDSSTISPLVSRKMAGHVAGRGAAWLDAAVTGSKHGAEKGELTFMVGGDPQTFERALPILQILGKKHIYCGLNGMGLSAKLAQNPIHKAGVAPEIMLEVLQSSLARAALTDFKAPFILKGDFTPYFPLKLMHKDLELAMEAAYAHQVTMPTLAAVKEVYSAAKATGKGDLDYAAIITYLEDLAGVKVRSS